jgi:phage baseplate assembly protein W
VNPTWQILPDPESPDVYTSEAPAENVLGANIVWNGRGLVLPFRWGSNGDFQSASGAALVRSAVTLVLGTMCSTDTALGELPWRPEFGSMLEALRLRNADSTLRELANFYIVKALERWIRDIRVRESKIYVGPKGKLRILVIYDVVDPGGTRILIPGLQTAVPVG